MGLVKAFLKAGILSEDAVTRDTQTGTPQGGILSPLLANIALSVLDEQLPRHGRPRWPAAGIGNGDGNEVAPPTGWSGMRDDFVVMVAGTRDHAEQLRG